MYEEVIIDIDFFDVIVSVFCVFLFYYMDIFGYNYEDVEVLLFLYESFEGVEVS